MEGDGDPAPKRGDYVIIPSTTPTHLYLKNVDLQMAETTAWVPAEVKPTADRLILSLFLSRPSVILKSRD